MADMSDSSTIDTLMSVVESAVGDRRTARRVVSAICDALGGGDVYIPRLDKARKAARAARLREQGLSVMEIARRLSAPRSTVYYWLDSVSE